MTVNSKKQQYVKMPIDEAFDEKTKHYLTFNTALLDTVLTIVEWVNVNKSATRFVRQEVKRELNGLSRQILKVKSTLGDRKGIIGGITPFTTHMVNLLEFMLESERNAVRVLALISALKDPAFLADIDKSVDEAKKAVKSIDKN